MLQNTYRVDDGALGFIQHSQAVSHYSILCITVQEFLKTLSVPSQILALIHLLLSPYLTAVSESTHLLPSVVSTV